MHFECFSPLSAVCRQTSGPEHRGPQEVEGEGPEEDTGRVGRVVQRLRREVRLHPQNH